MAFGIELSPDAEDHLRALRRFDQQRIADAIGAHLTNDPLQQTRNRKLLRSKTIATCELRIGDFRVYYDVDVDAEKVLVRAIGIKQHNRVSIGGVEVDLT